MPSGRTRSGADIWGGSGIRAQAHQPAARAKAAAQAKDHRERNDDRRKSNHSSLFPLRPGVYGAIAELHANAGEHTEAEESYRRELALAPQNARVNYRYGLVLLQLGKSDAAIQHLELAVNTDPTLMDAHLQLGKALLRQGRLDKASKSFRVVSEAAVPSEMKRSAHYQLSLVYRKMGRLEEAAHYLRLFEQLKEKQ